MLGWVLLMLTPCGVLHTKSVNCLCLHDAGHAEASRLCCVAESLCMSHACPAQGLLSMANAGPDTNDSHFSIMVEAAPHLNGHYTVFGEAVDGFEVGRLLLCNPCCRNSHVTVGLTCSMGLCMHHPPIHPSAGLWLLSPSMPLATVLHVACCARRQLWHCITCCVCVVTVLLQVIDAINALARDKPAKTATAADGAVIADSGQVRKGTHIPKLDQKRQQ